MKNDNNIEALFQQRYVIDPILQRSYEWELNRVVTLIEDIINNKIVGTNGDVCRYSIGEFLTYKKNDKDNFKYICDGQQRLTTLVLLFANIMHHLPKESERRRALYTLLYKNTGVMETVSVITLKEEDNSILNKILKSGIDNLTKEEKKSRLVRVYNKISDEFTKNMSKEELYAFCEKINHASYYERECESQEEAIKQFINLNGGHQSISNSRIGISMLFAIYDKMQPNNEIKQLLDELSKMSSKQASEFLCLYLYYRGCSNKDSDIPFAIKYLCENDKEDTLNNIANFYNNIYSKGIEQNPKPFMIQTSLQQVWIDLYTDKYSYLQNVDKTAKDIAYRKCEWGYICNRIKNGGSGEKGVFSGIFENFNNAGSNISQYVTEKLRDKGLYEPVNIINTYKQNKSNRGDDLFKRLLLVVEEEYKQSINVKETITHCGNPTLEHIHPQNPRENETYQCDDTMTNRFGNKTIIGGVANKSLSNKKFSDKWKDYAISPYYINSKHLSTYKEWTKESVEDNEKFYFDLLNKHYGLI